MAAVIPERQPHPTPHPPAFPMPVGACDCHFHVFAHSPRYPFAADRSYTPVEAPLSAYRALQRALGLERAVLVHPSVYGTDNRLLVDVLHENSDLRGVAVVDTSITDRELAEMDVTGVRGVRIGNAVANGVPVASLEPLAERIASFGWHVQLFVSDQALVELAPRIKALQVDVVIDHLGNIPSCEGLKSPSLRVLLQLLETGRVWVKLSGSYRVTAEGPPYADTIPIARALVAAAPDRVVWGSDWPHPHFRGPMPNDGDLLDLLAKWAPDEAVRKKILVDNPSALYGFG